MLNLNYYYRKNRALIDKYLAALDAELPEKIYLSDEDCGGNFGNITDTLLYNYNLNSNCYAGATKLVIVPSELKIVIKIGASGSLYEIEPDDEDDNPIFEYDDFSQCPDGDYCETEYQTYQVIKNRYPAALPFFLPVMKIQCGIHTFYLQQTYDTTYGNVYHDEDYLSSSNRSQNIIRHKMNNSRYHDINLANDWLEVGCDKYGAEAVNALLSFLVKTTEGQRANGDFHQGNYGFYEGSLPMIFDYAGYAEFF